jgi:hypothetical protein
VAEWLGPFAAWWALVIDRPKMLEQLATALPMMDRRGARAVLRAGRASCARRCRRAEDGDWGLTPRGARRAARGGDRARVGARRARRGARSRSRTASRAQARARGDVPGARARRRPAARRARRPGEGAAPRERRPPRTTPAPAPRRRTRRASPRWWPAPSAPGTGRCSTCGSRRSGRSRPRCSRRAVRRRHPIARRRRRPQPKKGAAGHRGLRAGEAARRGRNRLRVARAQARRGSLLRAQDPEGRRPAERDRRRAGGHPRVVRRGGRRRSPGSITRTSRTSSTAASRTACRSSCSST